MTADGVEYLDSYEPVDERGLFLSAGPAASLHDFLVVFSSAPHPEWAGRFSTHGIRDLPAERPRGTFTTITVNEAYLDDLRRVDDLRESRLLGSLADRTESLTELSGIKTRVTARLRDAKSLNCFVVPFRNGHEIVFNVGLIEVQNALSRLLGRLTSQDSTDLQLVSDQLALLGDFVVSGGSFGETSFPDVFVDLAEAAQDVSRDLRVKFCADALLTFSIGHELAHIRYAHDPKARKWNDELAADGFALELAMQSPEIKQSLELFFLTLGFWFEFLHAVEDGRNRPPAPPMTWDSLGNKTAGAKIGALLSGYGAETLLTASERRNPRWRL